MTDGILTADGHNLKFNSGRAMYYLPFRACETHNVDRFIHRLLETDHADLAINVASEQFGYGSSERSASESLNVESVMRGAIFRFAPDMMRDYYISICSNRFIIRHNLIMLELGALATKSAGYLGTHPKSRLIVDGSGAAVLILEIDLGVGGIDALRSCTRERSADGHRAVSRTDPISDVNASTGTAVIPRLATLLAGKLRAGGGITDVPLAESGHWLFDLGGICCHGTEFEVGHMAGMANLFGNENIPTKLDSATLGNPTAEQCGDVIMIGRWASMIGTASDVGAWSPSLLEPLLGLSMLGTAVLLAFEEELQMPCSMKSLANIHTGLGKYRVHANGNDVTEAPFGQACLSLFNKRRLFEDHGRRFDTCAEHLSRGLQLLDAEKKHDVGLKIGVAATLFGLAALPALGNPIAGLLLHLGSLSSGWRVILDCTYSLIVGVVVAYLIVPWRTLAARVTRKKAARRIRKYGLNLSGPVEIELDLRDEVGGPGRVAKGGARI